MKKRLMLYLLLLATAIVIMYFIWKSIPRSVVRDYPEIADEGILRIVTDYNSVGYYVMDDTIQGTQYDLCKAIEKLSGLSVEIHLENSLDQCIAGLEALRYDVIARNIPITMQTKAMISFTDPIHSGKQVLVQRAAAYNNGIQPIHNQIDLAQKTLYVPENSPSILRIRNLSEEIADTIYIQEVKQYNSEQLIYMVAHGDIDYAVVDEAIALHNQKNFPQIDVNTAISFTQLQAWAVRKNVPILLDSLNCWLRQCQQLKKSKNL